jgi:LysM repeat protein
MSSARPDLLTAGLAASTNEVGATMPIRHFVQQGECLSRIARRYGVREWRVVWDSPENEQLRAKRQNPNVLYPGDVVVIPDAAPRPKSLSCPSAQEHRFVAELPTRRLTLVLQDPSGNPLAGAAYRLVVGGKELEGTTDGDGVLERDVPADASEAALHLGPMVRRLAIGHLNPLRDTDDGGVTGVQARLANLGYAPGRVDGVPGPCTADAIRAFQEAHGLEPTGRIDDALLAELERAHGC